MSNLVGLCGAEGSISELSTLQSYSPGSALDLKYRIFKLEQDADQPGKPRGMLPLPAPPRGKRQGREGSRTPSAGGLSWTSVYRTENEQVGGHLVCTDQSCLQLPIWGPHPGPGEILQAQCHFRGTAREARWPPHIAVMRSACKASFHSCPHPSAGR